MSIEVQVKKLPQSEAEITITVSWEDWQKEIPHAVEHLSEHVKIAGFRAGKVPREILEQKVGKQVILDEAAEHAIQTNYPKVLEQEQIEAIGRPKAEIIKSAEGEALVFVVRTAVAPMLTLGEWRKPVKKLNADIAKKTVEVKDEEIDKELRKLAESRAKLIAVSRPAVLGDTAVVDFEVFVGGVLIEGGAGKQHSIVLGSGAFIPGFEGNVVGMVVGEEKTFELVFPTEYHAKHLAGKPASFHVTLQAVQEREIAPLDDAFAQSLGKFETIDALRASFREGMLEEKKQKTKEEERANLLDALVAVSKVELPRVLLDEELVRMLHEFEYQISSMGMEFDAYLEGIKKTKEQLFTEWEPQAKKRVTAALALDEVAREAELDPSHEEVEAEMNKTLQYYRNTKGAGKDIDMEKLFHHAKERLQNEMTFEYLENLK